MLTALFTILSLACALLSFASGVLAERKQIERHEQHEQFVILGLALAILGTVSGILAGAFI